MAGREEVGPVGMAVIRNVRRLRDRRGWTAQQLSERTGQVGYLVPRSVLANLESGRRHVVTVDELASFAAVLQVEPWSLTTDEPVCAVCRNEAPDGFACLTCGSGRLRRMAPLGGEQS
jgi:transcriptional regulator with XRE-family HTH domain